MHTYESGRCGPKPTPAVVDEGGSSHRETGDGAVLLTSLHNYQTADFFIWKGEILWIKVTNSQDGYVHKERKA
jgi:hypothetical protein